MEPVEAIIVKGIGGLYFLDTGDRTVTAKPKGIFRKDGTKPTVGDRVRILPAAGEDDCSYVITEILPRKNELVRPKAANVDCIVFVVAAADPKPDLMLLDRLLAVCIQKGIAPILAVNKADRNGEEAASLCAQYDYCCGGKTFAFSMTDPVSAETAVARLVEAIPEGLTVLAGQSGVGKSTLTNALLKKDAMETGEISKRADRGRQTTRYTEMFRVAPGKYITDSPGFSLFDAMDVGSGELREYYPEFAQIQGECRFPDCCHIGEPDCRGRELVEAGLFPRERYTRYCAIYGELKQKEKNRYK